MKFFRRKARPEPDPSTQRVSARTPLIHLIRHDDVSVPCEIASIDFEHCQLRAPADEMAGLRIGQRCVVRLEVHRLSAITTVVLEGVHSVEEDEDGEVVELVWQARFDDQAGLQKQLKGSLWMLFNQRDALRVKPDNSGDEPEVSVLLRWTGGEVEARLIDISTSGLALLIPASCEADLGAVADLGATLRLAGIEAELRPALTLMHESASPTHRKLGLRFDEARCEDLEGLHRELIAYVLRRQREHLRRLSQRAA